MTAHASSPPIHGKIPIQLPAPAWAGDCAHNMIYAKRLIYGSIDLLDNSVLDNSVSATISGLAGLDATRKATVLGYLITAGTRP